MAKFSISGTALIAILVLAGCRQLLGFEELASTPGDARPDTPVDASPDGSPVAPNLVFVTSQGHDGKFGTLAAADAFCQAAAADGPLAGTYVAMLSSQAVDGVDRLHGRGWVRPDGKLVFRTIADITAGYQLHPIVLDEHGTFALVQGLVGGPLGRHIGFGVEDCSNFTSNDSSKFGYSPSTSRLDSKFINEIITCDRTAHLICFGDDRVATLAIVPETGRIAFVSAETLAPGGSFVSSADTICSSEAAAAGLTGVFIAALATTTTSIATRIGGLQGPWRRPDGIVITSGILGSRIEAAIALDAHGMPGLQPTFWLGAEDLSAAATSNCNDWTTADGSTTTRGSSLDTEAFWSGVGVSPLTCNGPQPVLCLQH